MSRDIEIKPPGYSMQSLLGAMPRKQRHISARGRGNQGDWAPQRSSRKPNQQERRSLRDRLRRIGGFFSRGAAPTQVALFFIPIDPSMFVSTFARAQRRKSMGRHLPTKFFYKKARKAA